MISALASPTNNNYRYYQWKTKKVVDNQNPFEKKINTFSRGLEQILTSTKPIKDFSAFIIAEMYELRMMALAFLTNQKKNKEEIIEEIFEEPIHLIKTLKVDKRLEILAENVLFAMRCNKKVVEGFSTMEGSLFLTNSPLPQTEAHSKFLEIISSSFFIDFSLIALDAINENKQLVVTDEKINELALLVAEEAQNHIAAATELGFISKRANRKTILNETKSNTVFLQEQKNLANLGLDDFTKIFAK